MKRNRMEWSHNADAAPDGPHYAEWPEDYFPVAYRVRITGIVVMNSSYDKDENECDEVDLVREMCSNESLGIELIRLTDAEPTSPEVLKQREADKLRKAQEWYRSIRDKEDDANADERQGTRKDGDQSTNPSGLTEAAALVSGIYEAQGILPSKEDG